MTKVKEKYKIEDIIEIVCDYFDLNIETFHKKTNKREIVQARQIAMYFAKELTRNSLYKIGESIGGKDHATVLHAYKTVNNLIDTNKNFANYVNEIRILILKANEKPTVDELIEQLSIHLKKDNKPKDQFFVINLKHLWEN